MSEDQKFTACRYCGRTLPVEAIFCYYCQRELVTRPERPDSDQKNGSNWLNWVLLTAVGIIVILLIFPDIFKAL